MPLSDLRLRNARQHTTGKSTCKRLVLVLFISSAALVGGGRIPGVNQMAQTPPSKDTASRQDQQDTKRKLELGGDKAVVATTARPNAPPFKTETQAYALIVGISDYPNLPTAARLKYADADARELRDFLVSDNGGFLEENVTLLVNEQATRDQISAALAKLQNAAGPNSIALIFFAGHGVVNRSGQAFLVPANMTLEELKSENLLTSGIDMKSFNSTVQSMRARSAIIITDACHSGILTDSLSNANGGSVKNVSANSFAVPDRRDQTSFIFTAALPTQSSFERASLHHGLFTYYLLQGLKGPADADGDGLVTSKELYDYVTNKIRDDSEAKQIPDVSPAFDRSIPLAVLKEEARPKYLKWFAEDSIVARLRAAFDEALKENRLSRPQNQSAWDYFTQLKNYDATPTNLVSETQKALLAKISDEADRLIEESPKDASSWDGARDYLEKAFELTHDEGFKVRSVFASLMYDHANGNDARAEREGEDALDQFEKGRINNPLLSIRIGQFFIKQEKWDKAKRAYELTIENNPKSEWLTEYAQVLVRLGDYGKAEDRLRQAMQSTPEYLPALKLLVETLLHNPQSDRLNEAGQLVARARKLAPDDLDAEEQSGRLSLLLGKPAPAIESLSKVAMRRASGEDRNRSLLNLSNAFAMSGDLDRAISALSEAAAGSQDPLLYEALGARLEELGALDRAIAVAKKAVELTKADDQEKAKRVRNLAELLERSGQLLEAAYKYKEASLLTKDAKFSTQLEHHHQDLLVRLGRLSEAGIVVRPGPGSDRIAAPKFSNLIIPGGLEALQRLTGVSIDRADPVSLARVFDLCLRENAIASRVLNFYEQYAEFSRKVGPAGALELPASKQPPSPEAREILKYLGATDKNERREIKSSEFQSRQIVLEALGGDVAKFQRGESTTIQFRSDELPMLRGVEFWTLPLVKATNVKPDQKLLAFLKDQQMMKLYVAFSNFPDEAIKQIAAELFVKDKSETLPTSLYFAAPYLRFTAQGDLQVPGQQVGERNWRAALKAPPNSPLSRELFKKENGGALYLFCALSAAGDVGDYLTRQNFDQIYRTVEKSSLPVNREPFDLIDFFSLLFIDNGQLRLPRVGEVWMKSSPTIAVGDFLAKAGRISPGQQIPLVKQLAILNQIERELPDWTSRQEVIASLVKQIEAKRESELEVALDLQMDESQLQSFFAIVEKLDALPASAAKSNAIRSFQSGMELLRHLARNSLGQSRTSELTNSFLRMDPQSPDYGVALLGFVKSELCGAELQATGSQIDGRLIEVLAIQPSIELPSLNSGAQNANTQLLAEDARRFDAAAARQDQIRRFLNSQKSTKATDVIDALAALESLTRNPGATDELAKLKAAVNKFVEPEREPEPKKKKKPKTPVVVEPTLKESVAALTAPLSTTSLNQTRTLIVPFVGESLLAYVYAAAAGDASFDPNLVRNHDFGVAPWGTTQVSSEGKISGNTARLAGALALLEGKAAPYGASNSAFVAATIASAQVVAQRWISRRAEEYVARTIDLGEDVLAQYVFRDEAAKAALDRLDLLIPPRRAATIKLLLGQTEINKAIHTLTPSELFALGESYFKLRRAANPNLTDEPGALGTLARIFSSDAALSHEIRQFGVLSTARTGLARLDLLDPEPYEYAQSFRDGDRLAQRLQDVKLATIRNAHRLGGAAALPLSDAMTTGVLAYLFEQARKTASGATPPMSDWQSLVKPTQAPERMDLSSLIQGLSKSNYMRTAPRAKWNENSIAAPAQSSKP